MCSLSCLHGLLRRLVARSQSLWYYSQILALKAVEESFLSSFLPVLYFNNLNAEEDVLMFSLFCYCSLLS